MGRKLAHILIEEERERAELLRESIGSFSEEDVSRALATIKAFEAYQTPEMVRLRDMLMPEVMRWGREKQGSEETPSMARKVLNYLQHNEKVTPSELATAIKEEKNVVNAALHRYWVRGKLTREPAGKATTGLTIWRYSRIEGVDVVEVPRTGLSKLCAKQLAKNPGQTPAGIAKALDVDSSSISTILLTHLAAGKVRREEFGKSRSGLTVWKYYPVSTGTVEPPPSTGTEIVPDVALIPVPKIKKPPWNKGVPMSAEQKLKLSQLELARIAKRKLQNELLPVP